MEEAARALNDANVALYAVDARGLIGGLSGGTSGGESPARRRACLASSESPMPSRDRGHTGILLQAGGPVLAAITGVDTMNMLAGLTGGERLPQHQRH